jgi:hypothetical protein
MFLSSFEMSEFFVVQGIKIYANAVSERKIMKKFSSRKIL